MRHLFFGVIRHTKSPFPAVVVHDPHEKRPFSFSWFKCQLPRCLLVVSTDTLVSDNSDMTQTVGSVDTKTEKVNHGREQSFRLHSFGASKKNTAHRTCLRNSGGVIYGALFGEECASVGPHLNILIDCVTNRNRS